MIAAAVDDFSGRKEQDEEGEDGSDSASDFVNEMQDHMDSGTEEEMPDIMTAEDVQVGHQNENLDEDLVQQVFVPNDNGVITAIINSPLKRRSSEACNLSQSSQVCNPSQPTTHLVAATAETTQNATEDSDSDNSDDNDYVPHTDDSGEESEVVELRKHARKFREKMNESSKWVTSDASGVVPIDFIANVEEAVEEMEFESRPN
ncbi:hypothetical protein ZWY2020_030825 [Hordeum vulgare]|nr:hypothetical protein ZWY2020_030825 [Hordeum vulgare]